MKNKYGFTLIELLAVIVILAVIAMITTPIVIGIITDSKEEGNRKSIDGLVRAAKNFESESFSDSTLYNKIKLQQNVFSDLIYDGKDPDTAEIFVNTDGQIALAVKYDKKCYKKEYEGDITSHNVKDTVCRLNVGIDKPIVSLSIDETTFNSDGWSKKDFPIILSLVDNSGLGIQTIKKCTTTEDTCVPSETIGKENILINKEVQAEKTCVQIWDGFNNASDVVCTKSYNLDKTMPQFTGIQDLTVGKDTAIDLMSDVVVTDSLSGLKGEVAFSPQTIDTSKAGVFEVAYTAIDKAGNEKKITRKVIVSAELPTIQYKLTTPGSVNANGWGKSNFYVNLSGVDHSGHGIQKLVWCGTTSNTCTPSQEQKVSNYNILISMESSNNRVCAYAMDNYGGIGTTVCSDAYKLDKTAPIAPSINYNLGTTSLVVGNDSLSGYDKTTYQFTGGTTQNYGGSFEVTSVGTITITATAYDKAGNASVATKQVVISNANCTTSNGLCSSQTNASTGYRCSSGSLSGSSCYTNANYSSGYYYCGSGWSLSGSTCSQTNIVSFTQGGSCSCNPKTGAQTSCTDNGCPGGWKVGWSCSGSCRVGVSSVPCSNSCQKYATTTKSANYSSGYYYCNTGTLSGSQCVTSANSYYYCNSGTLSGSKCNITINACSSGTYKNGKCY